MGAVAIGQPISKNFSIRNSGKVNLLGSLEVKIDPPSRASTFTVTPGSISIAPGQSKTETVTFMPDQPNDSAAAIISTNDSTRPTIGVSLSGSGMAGKLSVPPTFTITGPVSKTTPATLTIRNTGKGLLSGDWATVMTTPYRVTGSPFSLAPGTTMPITINFSPSVKGNAPSAVLVIGVIAPSTSTTVVTLKGVGK